MGRRPLDRRCFRDRCAAARLQKWLPEDAPQDLHVGEVIVGRLPYSIVEARVLAGAGYTHLYTEDKAHALAFLFVAVRIGSVSTL